MARNLRRIRTERGITQEWLANESGVQQGHLSQIEAGKRNVSIDIIGAIAVALGVPVGAFFEERAPPARTEDLPRDG